MKNAILIVLLYGLTGCWKNDMPDGSSGTKVDQALFSPNDQTAILGTVGATFKVAQVDHWVNYLYGEERIRYLSYPMNGTTVALLFEDRNISFVLKFKKDTINRRVEFDTTNGNPIIVLKGKDTIAYSTVSDYHTLRITSLSSESLYPVYTFSGNFIAAYRLKNSLAPMINEIDASFSNLIF